MISVENLYWWLFLRRMCSLFKSSYGQQFFLHQTDNEYPVYFFVFVLFSLKFPSVLQLAWSMIHPSYFQWFKCFLLLNCCSSFLQWLWLQLLLLQLLHQSDVMIDVYIMTHVSIFIFMQKYFARNKYDIVWLKVPQSIAHY